MTKTEFGQCLEPMEKHYPKFYQQNVLAAMLREIGGCSANSLFKAVDALMMRERYLPEPAVLMEEVRKYERSGRKREGEWRPKENTPEEKRCAEYSMKLITGIIGGSLTHRQIIDGMQHMKNLFPKDGWNEVMHGKMAHLERTGTDPDSKPECWMNHDLRGAG